MEDPSRPLTLTADGRKWFGEERSKRLEASRAGVQRSFVTTAYQEKLPAGADKAEIVAHFDYYFDKAEAKEVAEAAGLKIAHMEALLDASDYKLLKVADGALTQEEYEPWKALRQHWRDTVNKMRACKTVEELDAITWAETPGELPAFLGA